MYFHILYICRASRENMRRYHQPLRGAPPASRLTPREDPVEIWRNRHRNAANLCLITIFNGKIHYFYGKSQFFWGKTHKYMVNDDG